jgi:hypothetical protein
MGSISEQLRIIEGLLSGCTYETRYNSSHARFSDEKHGGSRHEIGSEKSLVRVIRESEAKSKTVLDWHNLPDTSLSQTQRLMAVWPGRCRFKLSVGD